MKSPHPWVVGGLFLIGNLLVGAADPPTPPLPPLPRSPVAVFREWLALPEADQARVLATRSPAQAEVLRARLAEYEGLSPREREERLQATDLYWHFEQLLRRRPEDRAPLLESAPPELQEVLRQRLQVWDALPETDRALLLQHERTFRYFARLKTPVPTPPLPPGHRLSPAPSIPLRVQAGLANVANLPTAERERLQEQWKRLFDSPATDSSARALQGMSATERHEMERVLQRFRTLAPAQRQVCIDSFVRFTSMAPAERAAFLRHAERWESLPPEERTRWRQLVSKLPPLPPLPSPRPPLPPPALRGPARATNTPQPASQTPG